MTDYSRSEIEHTIDEWVLNEKYRRIMKRRLIDSITYERLAEEFEMSTSQIKRIVYNTEEKIFKHLPSDK